MVASAPKRCLPRGRRRTRREVAALPVPSASWYLWRALELPAPKTPPVASRGESRAKTVGTATLEAFPCEDLTLPLLAITLACASGASADEGMWPFFNMSPRSRSRKDHGTKLSDAWLDHVRLASVRYSSGGPGRSSRRPASRSQPARRGRLHRQGRQREEGLVAEGYIAGQDGPELKCPISS